MNGNIPSIPLSRPAPQPGARTFPHRRPLARSLLLCLTTLLLAACANGDFERIRPELVRDDIHAWMGPEAARVARAPSSNYPLTDEERLLRDLAYPLIEPPYDRNRWYSVFNEYNLTDHFKQGWSDRTSYFKNLIQAEARSPIARYNRLTSDIRNDAERTPPFFDAARRVLDTDRKREKSLDYVTGLTKKEKLSAKRRNSENALIVAWVQRSLDHRVASYRYALERLVISTPSQAVVETEQALTLLHARIAQGLALTRPQMAGSEADAISSQPIAVAQRSSSRTQ